MSAKLDRHEQNGNDHIAKEKIDIAAAVDAVGVAAAAAVVAVVAAVAAVVATAIVEERIE